MMHNFAGSLCLASQQGAKYLISRQLSDGRIGTKSILDYYKAPLALTSTGYTAQAWRLLRWIKENVKTGPGQFHQGDSLQGLLRSSTYRNSFIMLGALLSGYFDILRPEDLANFRSYFHPSTGAFLGEQEYTPDAYLNTNHTSLAGIFCIYNGMLELAELCAEYVLKHFENQPRVEEVFYIHTDMDGNLITDFDPSDSFWHIIDYAQPKGHFWAIGTGAAFLAQLYQKTKQVRYLEGARNLIDLVDLFVEGFEAWPSSGKLAWGAARLYAATGEKKYCEVAQRIGKACFADTQDTSGSWGPFLFNMSDQGASYELPILELTAEFTFLSSEVSRCLSVY
jgi:hypothetical protein